MSLEQVAKRAGVSTATVSRALNGLDTVKNSTKSRVVKAAELQYHPNLHARSLASGRNRSIGIIVSNFDNPFFLDVVGAVEADCRLHGYEVVVANTSCRSDQLAASVRLMIGRRVEGLAVIVSEMDDEILRDLKGSNTPIVFFDFGLGGGNITKIRVNYRRGIDRTVDYLAALGHRTFGFVGHHSALGPLDERRMALTSAVAAAIPGASIRFATDRDSLTGGSQAARELLGSGLRPTAIVCANDLMAVGVLKELRERGLWVPDDVSVTGFDNIMLSEFCYPALTTVHIPRDRIGHTIFTSLARDSSGSAGREFVIEPELVIRDSTGPAPAGSL